MESHTLDARMGRRILEARNSKCHDFLVFQPGTGPQNQLYLSLERLGHLKNTKKKSGNILGKYYFCKYENSVWFKLA